uniref:Uncharacterized protein n=1 Tax=Kwoniella pini CBS 10737 TaxID=1296096 RepID=A0A1B9I9G5_9TREE|nr:uncharacterized protein I206_01392 [Kwoniella pini CBS 10737]OCF52107.1 hypothetical protein I206_01392 [Kwoniella pini CBS 10737]
MSDPVDPTTADGVSPGIPIDPSRLSTQIQPAASTLASAISVNPDPVDPAVQAESSTTQAHSIPISTLEAAMSSIVEQAEIPASTSYIPNTGVNGRRASSSGGKGLNGQHRSVGPELTTPSLLSETSGGIFIPTGEPPYEPPADIIYPPDKIANPFWGDMAPQPIIENFPANSLYRPKYLPADIDDRLDKRSVWIGIEKDSSRAVYFLPPTCQCCKNPAVAQHCDRGWPKCARCVGRGVICIPGKAWGMMRPKGKRRNLKAEAAKTKPFNDVLQDTSNGGLPGPSNSPFTGIGRLSSKEKGKAPAHTYIPPPPLPSLPDENRATSMSIDQPPSLLQSKPQKKRKLSIAVEGDPKRVRRKSNRDAVGPLTHPTDLPLTRNDQAYFSRLEDNARKPPLSDMYGPCPVWAKTKSALQSAAEYLREPRSTAGASVEIGVGGVARGVILEGEVKGVQGNFWGSGRDSGTIITAIGQSRRQRSLHYPSCEPPRLTSPVRINANCTSSTAQEDQKPDLDLANAGEKPEITALLMAQRARTPVAVAVAQDYSAVPFKVPRPLVVLGWFWITDAWLEPIMPDIQLFTPSQNAPAGRPEEVIWKFRFEWCTGGKQDMPWWSSNREPRQSVYLPSSATSDHTWSLSGTDRGSTTVSAPTRDVPMEMDETSNYQHTCDNCRYTSERIYETGDICLNEACSWFFGDAASNTNRIGPMTNRPAPARPRARIQPETLGLRLRPPQPTGISHDVTQAHAGREFWRGWVCDKCGSAQERYKWTGWCCEACGHSIQPPRRVYTAEDLRLPSRPVCTSARQEDGYASFPFQTQRSWSLFPLHIKVVKHSLDHDLFGNDSQVQHSLAHEGNGVNEVAGKVLRGLQVQGGNEVPLRRYTANSTTRRPVELALSPFYTYLCGSDPSPFASFPTYRTVHWQDVPPVCLDAIDLVNTRAGSMFPGQPEFGSLLIVANPPNSSTSLNPKLVMRPNTYMAILFLGSDATVRIRSGGVRHKQGELTVQHGDVIGFRAGSQGIEAALRMENFGFFCIARHARATDLNLPQTPTSDSNFSESFLSHLHARSHSQPSSSVEPLSATFPPQHDINPSRQNTPNTPIFAPKKTQSRPKSVTLPKITKLAEMNLENWYIGAYPLDQKQFLRILKPYRIHSASETGRAEETGDVREEQIMVIDQEKEEFTQIDPIPLSPLPGYDDLFPEPEPEPILPSKKSTPASKKAKASTMTPSATPTSGKKRKGPRISTSATPAGSVIDPEEGTPSLKGTTSGTKKAKGRSRKSLA